MHFYIVMHLDSTKCNCTRVDIRHVSEARCILLEAIKLKHKVLKSAFKAIS